ncbi:MAG: hypothetical protein ABIH67_03465 [Candidatus Uhrbacteria bacterium]
MKKIKNKIIIGMFVGVLAISGFLSTVSPVQAIGVAPPMIAVENVHRDFGVTKSIRVSRAINETGDIILGAVFEGTYAHHFTGPDSITIPADQSGVEYEFTILPTDAASGDYTGRVVFYVMPDNQEGTGNAKMYVIKGTAVTINYTVSGEELLAYEVLSMSAYDTEVERPVYVTYTVANLGNVEWRPERIELTFTDIEDETNVQIVDINSNDIEVVNPGVTESYQVAVDVALSEAKYQLSGKFYYQGQLIATLDGRTFSVYPEGTLDQFCELVSLVTNKDTYQLGEKVKLEALVKNTGDLPVSSVLYTEIYFGDELLDMVRGQEIIVSQGQEEILSEIIDLDNPGTYSFSSYVQYGSKKTSFETVEITVLPPPTAVSWLNSTVGIIILALLIILIAIIIKLRRRKKTVPVQVQPTPPPPPAVPTAPVQPPPTSTPLTPTQPPVDNKDDQNSQTMI